MERRTNRRFRPAALPLIPALLLLGGCDPIFDVAGAYFPSWVVCFIAGFAVTVVVRDVLVRTGLDPHLGSRLFSYLGLFAMTSATVWLIFFST